MPVAAGLLVAAALLAYSNSFHGPFVFDDATSIPENPHIRRLWPIWEAMKTPPGQTVDGRPILSLSLAVNYRLSDLEVSSYHAANLAIHVLAGLLLFGIVRRTLLTDRLRARFGKASTVLAFFCALIWLVHPLQTASVTYVIQRAESLMGLFCLLTLYCAIRGFASSNFRWWYPAAIVACGLGMGTKEVMFAAPLLVFLYDRVFISRSFKEVLRRRGLYVGLAATWIILGICLYTATRGESVGFGFDITAAHYAKTQSNIIIRDYLKLAFWPDPLVFDYGWPMAGNLADYAPSAIVLLALLVATAVALQHHPPLGFLGVWFFLILGPTSSFLPIVTEIAAEHRMYLPLAAVITGVIACVYVFGERLSVRFFPARDRPRALVRLFECGLALAAAAVLGLLTFNRNIDYRSRESIWQDTIDKQPRNSRAQNNLGSVHESKGQYDQAIRCFDKAIELNPRYSTGYTNRGLAYEKKGLHDLAIRDLNKAIELNPNLSKAYCGRGIAYGNKGQYDRAIRDYDKAIELKANYAMAYNNRGTAYEKKGDMDRAITDYDKAIELQPLHAPTYNNRAIAYGRKGHWDYAIRDYNKAIELDPSYLESYKNRAGAYHKKGYRDEAIRDYDRIIELSPYFAWAYNGRAVQYGNKGQYGRAIRDYNKAIELDPNDPLTYNNRGIAHKNNGQLDEAIRDFDKAIELDPGYASACNNRGIVYGKTRNYELAIRDFSRAIELNPKFISAYSNRGNAHANIGNRRQAISDYEKAIQLAHAAGRLELAEAIGKRLKLCKAQRSLPKLPGSKEIDRRE